MSKKNVFLIRNVWPQMYGGGETYQLELAKQLKKHGFNPIIVSSSIRLIDEARKVGYLAIMAPFLTKQNYSGWKNVFLPVYYFKILNLRGWYKKIFMKYRPSVINVQSRDEWLAATRAAKKMGIRVLWTDHMDFRSWVLKNVNVWYKGWIGKWVLKCARLADTIITISDYERKWLEKTTSNRSLKNVITIKNGVLDEFGKYEKIQPKKHSFCYVGRVVDYKGVGDLINAFKMVRAENTDASLNIYGDGDIDEFGAFATNGVSFYGYTDAPLRAIAENDVFVLPSHREGLSLSLLDAAMMGKKIIVSDVGGNPEVIKNMETGLSVPAKNELRLAEAMTWMLDNPMEAEKMAKKVRKFYEENYDLTKIFEEKMLPLYNEEKE